MANFNSFDRFSVGIKYPYGCMHIPNIIRKEIQLIDINRSTGLGKKGKRQRAFCPLPFFRAP